jgi:hypothetical protein
VKRKYSRKNRAVLSGMLVGIASIYAVASYFDLNWSELGTFMLGTLLFFGGIVLLAALAVTVFKLIGRLVNGPAEAQDDIDNERE